MEFSGGRRMNREELLKVAKPILFNTEMTKALLDGRKTVTRRVIKPQPDEKHQSQLGFVTSSTDSKNTGFYGWGIDSYGGHIQYAKPRYKVGDILWVRETWCESRGRYYYKADNICTGCTEDGTCLPKGVEKHITCKLCEDRDGFIKWHPSIHMSKSAARIFLKVINVRVEQIKDITEKQALAEGFTNRAEFLETIFKIYPDCTGESYLWVIEFERVEEKQ